MELAASLNNFNKYILESLKNPMIFFLLFVKTKYDKINDISYIRVEINLFSNGYLFRENMLNQYIYIYMHVKSYKSLFELYNNLFKYESSFFIN